MMLEIPFKQKLVEVFNIIKTGSSEIRDNHVVSDGYTQSDLKAITLEKMNAYIGSEESSFLRAWEVTLSKVNFELNPPVGEIVASKEVPGAMEFIPVQEVIEIKEAPIVIMAETEADAIKQAEVIIEAKEEKNDTKKSK